MRAARAQPVLPKSINLFASLDKRTSHTTNLLGETPGCTNRKPRSPTTPSGESRPGSDVDLLVIARNLPRDRFERVNHVHRLVVGRFWWRISVLAKEPDDARYWLTLAKGYLDKAER